MACVLLDAVLTQVLSTLSPMRNHIDWVVWVGGSYVGVDEWLYIYRRASYLHTYTDPTKARLSEAVVPTEVL